MDSQKSAEAKAGHLWISLTDCHRLDRVPTADRRRNGAKGWLLTEAGISNIDAGHIFCPCKHQIHSPTIPHITGGAIGTSSSLAHAVPLAPTFPMYTARLS